MHLKRGHQITSYEKIETENRDFFCYYTVEKEKHRNSSVQKSDCKGERYGQETWKRAI